MRKIFIYFTISLFFLIPTLYFGFWYFASWKAKSFFVKVVSNILDEESKISYDKKGFPSNLIFQIKNPKFSNENLMISSDALLVKNRLFDKSLHIYIPSNKIDIIINNNEKSSISCNVNSKSHFVIKLKNLPFSSQFSENTIILDYINTLIYKDYGLKCDILHDSESNKSIITEINEKANYVKFKFNKKSDENFLLGFDLYLYRFKDITNPENYFNFNIGFNYEFFNEISASKINFDIERFLIKSNDFSITVSGGIHDYNLVTSSFKDKIHVDISNYKKLLPLMIDKKSNVIAFQELLFSLSDKISDNHLQFAIRYDDNLESSFIGNLPIDDFINKVNKITKNERSY